MRGKYSKNKFSNNSHKLYKYIKKLKTNWKLSKKIWKKKEELIMNLFDNLELAGSSESNSLKV